jgi:hypothetical protein
MKSINLIIALFFGTILFAQDCHYEEISKGTYWVMTNFDKKGKLESSSAQTIKYIDENAKGVEYFIHGIVFDKKGKETQKMDFSMICNNGEFTMDLSKSLPAETLASIQSMEVQITGDGLKYPVNLATGAVLPDASVNVKAVVSGMTVMDMTSEVSNRVVEAQETIAVGAGEFNCFRIRQTTTIKNKLLNNVTEEVQWFSPGIGVIKAQFYDKKGSEAGHTELTEYRKG